MSARSVAVGEPVWEGLQENLAQVKPWPDHLLPWVNHATNYPHSSWIALVATAGLLQRSDPENVEKALRRYQSTYPFSEENDSKLLLLLRVLFDLPEERGRQDWVGFGGWRDVSGSENMRTNAAWPIEWNGGKPALVVGFTLFQGARYDSAAEYRYFLAKYPMRNLSSFSK